MALYAFEGNAPRVHPEAWVAPTATLIGNVVLERNVSIWYGAVLRADLGRIVIREGTNIQDNSVVHVSSGTCEIGPNVTVGHQCLVHHCTIGAQAVIGNGAIVLDEAVIGPRSFVAAGSTVLPRTQVPAETLVLGSPAKKMTPLTAAARAWIDENAEKYQQLARRHATGIDVVRETLPATSRIAG